MLLTIIESPYAGDLARNKEYLRRAIWDCLGHAELPFASHGFFPHFLDDTNPRERLLGIGLGYNFWPLAKKIAFYIDYGMSSGMQLAWDKAMKGDHPPIERRTIGQNP